MGKKNKKKKYINTENNKTRKYINKTLNKSHHFLGDDSRPIGQRLNSNFNTINHSTPRTKIHHKSNNNSSQQVERKKDGRKYVWLRPSWSCIAYIYIYIYDTELYAHQISLYIPRNFMRNISDQCGN